MLALLLGALHLWLGAALRRYRPWARLLALGLAVINLVLFPFGTALGGYAFWVLLTDEGRALYRRPRRRPTAHGSRRTAFGCELNADS